MGIADLVKFLRKYSPRSFVPWEQPLSVGGTSVAIDVPLFAHKFCQVDQTTRTLEERFDKMIHRLKTQDQIEKVFLVFDGAKTPLKDREREKRAIHREKYQQKQNEKALMETIQFVIDNPDAQVIVTETEERPQPTSSDMKRLQEQYKHMDDSSISVVRARQEAEAKVAHLVRTSQAAWAITDDSDVFAFLCPQTLLYQGKERCREQVRLQTILEDLSMTPETFQEFSVLCGCDFLDRLPLVGPEKLYKLVKTSSHLVDAARTACKDESFKESHLQHWPEVIQFFQTCAQEMEPLEEPLK